MDNSFNAAISNSDSKLSTQSKVTKLNPNAAEFVPFSLRSPTGSSIKNSIPPANSGIAGKAKMDRSESSISNSSDDEVHQYWRRKLPDDITPDFKFMEGEETREAISISLAGLSMTDAADNSRIPDYLSEAVLLNKQQGTNLIGVDNVNLDGMMRYTGARATEGMSRALARNSVPSTWKKQLINDSQNITNGSGKGQVYNEDPSAFFPNDMVIGSGAHEKRKFVAVKFLATHFPGFAAESLLQVYYASGCDMNLSFDMLTQLEQGDNVFNQNLSSKTLSAPNLASLDFTALAVADKENEPAKYFGREKENFHFFKPSSTNGATLKPSNFTSAVNLSPRGSGQWKLERKGSFDANSVANRQSHFSANPYDLHERSSNGASTQAYGQSRPTPVLFGTREAFADLSSEFEEEARDHARLQSAFFEEASQAYHIGNKALARELGAKSQIDNIQMKAVHGRARDSIYQPRDPAPAQLQSFGRGQDAIIHLPGLSVDEAIHILKQELNARRTKARSVGRPLQALIFIGTGHNIKGSRTPTHLAIAVEKYLTEEECLEFSEVQPGLLRVVVY